jgi:hypothetical protein
MSEPPINANEHEGKHWALCHDIVGVFYAVYNELGQGFLEAVYEEALAIALTEAGMAAARQVPTPIWFRGRTIKEYKADFDRQRRGFARTQSSKGTRYITRGTDAELS